MRCARRLLVSAGVAALLAACSSAKDAPTVGSTTRSNGLAKSGRFIVKTPSILRVTLSGNVPGDPQAAIDEYDRLLETSAEPELQAEAMRRSAYLRVQRADSAATVDDADLRKAIALYLRLLDEFPGSADNDLVLYQLARAQQLAGEADQSVETLRRLGQQFPNSPIAADGSFRVAELLYQRGRYAEAQAAYRQVLSAGAATPYFETAQYKYGWSLYKQGNYAEALPVFLAILDRELPPGDLTDPQSALSGVPKTKAQVAADSLRVASLSFAALGGGSAVNDYWTARGGEPRDAILIYAALGSTLLDQRRYTDAAAAYSAFVTRHPAHPLSPDFQSRSIAAYERGDFGDLTIKGKETYVGAYEPGAPYWGGKPPTPAVLAQLRRHLEDIGRFHQTRAQQTSDGDAAARRAEFLAAAGSYRKLIAYFPDDPALVEVNLLLADSLYDAGQSREAALEYLRGAYAYPANAKAAEMAYAAVQAYQRLASEVSPADRSAALRDSVAASLKLADTFPAHPQLAAVLARAARDLYEAMDLDQAVVVSGRVLALRATAADLRRQALGVIADARYAQQRYADAESAYAQLLPLLDRASPECMVATEQLAAAIYKQGEAARASGDPHAAALAFERVGRVAPEARIRATSDFDAAAAFMAAQEWPAAEAALEGFRQRAPAHALIADADKKLAVAYQKDHKPVQSADAYARVARRASEAVDARREAAWLAAQLYRQAQASTQAAQAYEYYLAAFPQPLDRALEARRYLADAALNEHHDEASYARWLREIVNADAAAGPSRSDQSRLLAAQANLELGRADAAGTRRIALVAPLATSLRSRKAAVENAVANLSRAAGYGFADITPAATYEIAMVYRDLGHALLASERPAKFKGEVLEQYNVLLEEQAYPFEQKAIEAHEANLQRLRQGLWNDWIRRSAWALAELEPGKYGKREIRDNSYESIR